LSRFHFWSKEFRISWLMEELSMRRHELTDEQWTAIEPHLPGKKSDPGRTAGDNRLFVNAVFWIARTGAPWRDLPERFGPWGTVYKRFNRWCKRGVWGRVLEALGGDTELSNLLLDSTIVRAHQHAAGAKGGKIPKHWEDLAATSAPRFMLR
jgi:transposase